MKASRVELFRVLAELSDLFPEWRFGQLVANVASAARGPQVESIWDVEDEELTSAAQQLVERNIGRKKNQANTTDAKRELEAAIQRLVMGIRDDEAADKARERMDRMREEMRQRVGTVEVAVELIREVRGG